jgi:hypothetical protein
VRVAVIQHPRQNPLRRSYGLGLVAECWQARGISVVEATDPRRPPDADLAVLHVDLTVVPEEFLMMAASYPVALNCRTRDISKRAFSRLLVAPGDGWEGPVVVKTNLNCHGSSEKQLLGRTGDRDPWRFVPLAVSRRLRHRLEPLWSRLPEYRVFPSAREVPPDWWDEESLVIERFVPERSGDAFVVRRCMFLGDRHVNTVFRSSAAIARGGALRDAEREDPPDELLTIREALGLDFGRLDYAMVEGRVVLYDVNRTPSMLRRSERLLGQARELEAGIGSWIARLP